MDIVLKVLSVILLGIGAFLVYGAKFVAVRIEQGKLKDSQTPDSRFNPANGENGGLPDTIGKETSDDDDADMVKLPNRTVINVKMAGMAFVLAGGLLAMVAFR